MHSWRTTPSTGRNFQTSIIWITEKTSSNGSISVNKFFFLDIFNFCWVFQKFPFFWCHPVFIKHHRLWFHFQFVNFKGRLTFERFLLEQEWHMKVHQHYTRNCWIYLCRSHVAHWAPSKFYQQLCIWLLFGSNHELP